MWRLQSWQFFFHYLHSSQARAVSADVFSARHAPLCICDYGAHTTHYSREVNDSSLAVRQSRFTPRHAAPHWDRGPTAAPDPGSNRNRSRSRNRNPAPSILGILRRQLIASPTTTCQLHATGWTLQSFASHALLVSISVYWPAPPIIGTRLLPSHYLAQQRNKAIMALQAALLPVSLPPFQHLA